MSLEFMQLSYTKRFFLKSYFHRHLAPLQIDFTDIRTGLRLCFFLFISVLFSIFSYRYFLPFKFFCLRSLISPITVCFLIFIFYFFSSIWNIFSFFSSSCARLNWQLACQFSSANRLSYRIVSYGVNVFCWQVQDVQVHISSHDHGRHHYCNNSVGQRRGLSVCPPHYYITTDDIA